MKLISIKAHGFKSFADRIEINLTGGITGIVGPNGSGKSNIVDAIKWVLGEQSIKNLRGSEKMTDVIFNGSASRKPMTRAWVSLTFDNSDHYLKSEFEILEIKRVVYSTGENEYYINNSKVRLKDITELFIDSGASTNSFSIISQGKISEVLNGKVTDRRNIIEEAAGVLKYKKHKEETLRKIDKANDNIEKVDLVIKELENQIEPLKKQKDDALKYQKLKSENDELDITLTTLDLKNSETIIKDLNNKINKLNDEINSIDVSTTSDNSKIEKLKLQNTNLDTKINTLQDKLIDINKEISNIDAERQVMQERKKYEVDNIKLQDNLILLKEKQLRLNKDIEVIEHTLKDLEIRKNSIIKKRDENNSKIRKSLEKRDNITRDINNKNIKLLNVKNKINILENNINNETNIPNSVKSIINSKSLKGIHNIVGKLIDVDDKYKDALNVALGYNTNVIVVDNEESAKKAIIYLKTEKLGRCTFFPINIIKPKYISNEILNTIKNSEGFIDTLDNLVKYDNIYTGIIKNLLGNVIVVKDIDTMNKLGKQIKYSYRIVTLDGEILHTGGSLTGGTKTYSNSIILDKLELSNNKDLLNSLQSDINSKNETLNILNNEYNDLIKEKEMYNEEYNNVINIINLNLKNIDNYKKGQSDILSEINGNNDIINNSLDKTLENLLQKLYDYKKEKEILEDDLSKLKIEKNDCSALITELELKNRKINSDYNKLISELKNNEIELSRHEIKMDNNLIKLNEEYHITFDYAIKNYDTNIDVKSYTSRLNTIKRELELLPNINLGSIEEYDRINERFEFLTSQKMDLISSINNLMEVIDELDETMQEKFIDTFNKVNLEFNKVFKKLFKGGIGELHLTDPTDILNTGVDITACPPGKTLKSINLLSGGEKTLTAIALLFAILNIRYVPFCILDEVEAALDEANVDMFGNYVKEYENKTEFIIITHKKRTMEYANTLYGITMQESGVSKLVSVKLENIN